MWERHNIAGQQALSQGRTQEAEAQFRLALTEAEKSGLNDPKVPQTLNNLANCLRQQGRYADADPLYLRAIELKGKQVGPLHKDMIPYFENYAKMLRAAGKEKEAEKMEFKAKAIFAKM